MTPTVYAISGSPCAWRVLLGFAFADHPCEVIYLQGNRREHESPAFLALNPRGKVPVLQADGLLLRDSLAILDWIDTRTGHSPLFPADQNERAYVWQDIRDCDEYLLPATNAVVFPVFGGEGDLPENNREKTQLVEAVDRLEQEFNQLETRLSRGPYLSGDHPGAYDAVAYPDIARVQRARDTRTKAMIALGYDQLDSRFPALSAWRHRIARFPGVAGTIPPHWQARTA